MLRSQKLLEASSKPPQAKPPYVKPKHKTYRELLGLDRPKKQIFLQSDDEGDDFLEKLLRDEQDKKKKKKQKGKSKSKRKGKSSSQNKQPKKQLNKTKEKQKQAEQPSIQEQKVDAVIDEDYVNPEKIEEDRKDGEILKEGEMRIWKRMESAQKSRKRERTSSSKRTHYPIKYDEQIMIDEDDDEPYIVNNALKVHNRFQIRSEKGMRTLKQLWQNQKVEGHRKVNVKTVIDLKRRTLSHKFKQQKNPVFKAKILTTQQILLMTKNPNFESNRRKPSFIREETLFRTHRQEQVFLKSLKKTEQFRKTANTFKNFY